MILRPLFLLALMCLFTSGCAQPDSENAARKHLTEEFRKWMAGEENEVVTPTTYMSAPPIGYEIYSVTPTSPFMVADKNAPAFQFKVSIKFISKASTELTRSHTYVLTWDADKGVWDVQW